MIKTDGDVRRLDVHPPPTMERYIEQSRQWQNLVCSKLTAPIENVLRSLYSAARYTVEYKGMSPKDVDPIFRIMVSRIPTWPDDECAKEFSEQSKEINSCIRMAVRAQAIVMALTISRQCNEVIHVPNSEEFFRKVTMDTATEHSPEIFGLRDCESRKTLRNWISDNISKQLMSLVPVSLFTEEDENDDEVPEDVPAAPTVPRALDGKIAGVEHVEIPPSTPAVCDDEECTPPIIVKKEPIPSSPPPQRREEPVGTIVVPVEPPTAAIAKIPEEVPSTPPTLLPSHVENKTVALIPYEDKGERQSAAIVSSKIGLGEVRIESYDESEEFV
jgi:hypothetical protein